MRTVLILTSPKRFQGRKTMPSEISREELHNIAAGWSGEFDPEALATYALALLDELETARKVAEETVRCPSNSMRPKILAHAYLAKYSKETPRVLGASNDNSNT
jgi:hypothetical protein